MLPSKNIRFKRHDARYFSIFTIPQKEAATDLKNFNSLYKCALNTFPVWSDRVRLFCDFDTRSIARHRVRCAQRRRISAASIMKRFELKLSTL